MRKNVLCLKALCIATIGFMSCSHNDTETGGSQDIPQPEKPTDSYLFAYFPDNSNENLFYAVSSDGFNYTPINRNQKVLASDTVTMKKGMRDPFVTRGKDGKFYMVATDMKSAEGWDSNRGIVMLTSDDLINWKHSTVFFPERFPEWSNVTRVWAPETIWDPEYQNADGTKGRYMVYYSLLTNDGKLQYDRIFYSYANDDFTDLISDPVLLYAGDQAVIDGDIVFDEKTSFYHMVFKDEAHGGIFQVTSPTLTANEGQEPGSQWGPRSQALQQTDMAVEGAEFFKLIDGETWVLMYDCYGNDVFQFCISKDLETFRLKTQTTAGGNFHPRHGSVVIITPEEREKLLTVFPIK